MVKRVLKLLLATAVCLSFMTVPAFAADVVKAGGEVTVNYNADDGIEEFVMTYQPAKGINIFEWSDGNPEHTSNNELGFVTIMKDGEWMDMVTTYASSGKGIVACNVVDTDANYELVWTPRGDFVCPESGSYTIKTVAAGEGPFYLCSNDGHIAVFCALPQETGAYEPNEGHYLNEDEKYLQKGHIYLLSVYNPSSAPTIQKVGDVATAQDSLVAETTDKNDNAAASQENTDKAKDTQAANQATTNQNVAQTTTQQAEPITLDSVKAEEAIVLTVNKADAAVFGKTVTNDVAPIIRNGRTMLPARFVAEALGATIDWNAETKTTTITAGEGSMDITIGADTAVVNGKTVKLDSAAFIDNSRTYLPIRFIAENLGATVLWDAATKNVVIVPNK